MGTPGVFEEIAVDYMGRVEVSISAVPAATHVPVSVTSYYTDANITCAAEYAVRGSGLSFSVLFQKWKNGWQLHADEGCINKTCSVGVAE